MVSCKSFVIALAFGVEALAGSAPKPICATKLGTSPVKYVKSQTSTKTQTVTQTKVIQKKKDVTVTPNPTTVTVFATKFNTVTVPGKQNTDTVTTTIVERATASAYLTYTHEATDVRTVTITTTSTSTSTPPGFTPVASQLALLQQPVPRALNIRAAAVLEERKTSKPLSVKCDKNGKPVPNVSQYPQAVNCVQIISKTIVKTSTSTVKGYTVTLALSTKVKQATTTSVVTETSIPPDAEETITSTSTLTITTTIQTDITTTVTATSTVQNVIPTTINGACLADNLVTQDNKGNWVTGVSVGGNVGGLSTLSAGSGYDCCMACQSTPFCTGAVWLGFGCFALVDTVCHPSQALTGSWSSVASGSGRGYTASNGPCGMLVPPS